jgi:hypothetical protein
VLFSRLCSAALNMQRLGAARLLFGLVWLITLDLPWWNTRSLSATPLPYLREFPMSLRSRRRYRWSVFTSLSMLPRASTCARKNSLIPAPAITRAESKFSTHMEVELGRRDAEKDIEFSVPLDQPQYPSFRFSTGASWQTVATAYERIVSQQTSVENAKSLFSELGVSNAPSFASEQQAAES